MSPTRIAELAATIADNTTYIDSYLTSHAFQHPSFDTEVPSALFSETRLEEPRRKVLEATRELQDLMLSPAALVMDHVLKSTVALQAIYRFDIISRFAGRVEVSYDELAHSTGLSLSNVRRIVRSAIANRIFRESRPGYIGHTAASKLLETSPLLHQWLGMACEEIWPAASRGFNIANNTDDSIFIEISKFPARAARFADAMELFSHDPGYAPTHLLEHYSKGGFDEGILVDVGGSSGTFAFAIARAHPSVRCIVQDRPKVVENAADSIPTELLDRVSFMAHDFFSEQPVRNADTYLFRWILHDWSDAYAVRILKALTPALKQNARILVHEYVLPDPKDLHTSQERVLRTFDMYMMALCNGKEREAEEWSSLFRNADERFEFIGITQPPLSKLAIIEARWVGGL